MYAVTIIDKELRWSEHPDPSAGVGEIVVDIASAGINGADRLQVAGFYPAPAGSPADIPGLEFAGVVSAVGPGAARFNVGDRVMGVVGGGGQAQRIAVHERLVMPVPTMMSDDEAGGFTEVFTTAHDALFTQAGLGMGERILIHGAAGGVGVAAIQMARAAGAHVTVTARHTELHERLIELGAHRALTPDEFAEGNEAPFDVVLELVGAANLAMNLRLLAMRGRIVIIGVGAGPRTDINLLDVMNKRAHIMGSTLRARSLEDKAVAARAVERHVLPLVESGAITVPVHERWPMTDADAAYNSFSAGRKLGKIVLVND